MFLSHSCVSSKMVADAISERGQAMALGQVAAPRWAPREHPAAEGQHPATCGGIGVPQTRGNIVGSLRRLNSLMPIGSLCYLTVLVLFPLCCIGNLHRRSSVHMQLAFASALRVALYLSVVYRKRSRDAQWWDQKCWETQAPREASS